MLREIAEKRFLRVPGKWPSSRMISEHVFASSPFITAIVLVRTRPQRYMHQRLTKILMSCQCRSHTPRFDASTTSDSGICTLCKCYMLSAVDTNIVHHVMIPASPPLSAIKGSTSSGSCTCYGRGSIGAHVHLRTLPSLPAALQEALATGRAVLDGRDTMQQCHAQVRKSGGEASAYIRLNRRVCLHGKPQACRLRPAKARKKQRRST